MQGNGFNNDLTFQRDIIGAFPDNGLTKDLSCWSMVYSILFVNSL